MRLGLLRGKEDGLATDIVEVWRRNSETRWLRKSILCIGYSRNEVCVSRHRKLILAGGHVGNSHKRFKEQRRGVVEFS